MTAPVRAALLLTQISLISDRLSESRCPLRWEKCGDPRSGSSFAPRTARVRPGPEAEAVSRGLIGAPLQSDAKIRSVGRGGVKRGRSRRAPVGEPVSRETRCGPRAHSFPGFPASVRLHNRFSMSDLRESDTAAAVRVVASGRCLLYIGRAPNGRLFRVRLPPRNSA